MYYLIIGIGIIALILLNYKKESMLSNKKTNIYDFTEYEKKDYMTMAEKMFYKHLYNTIKPEYVIIPQVVISNFIKCNNKALRNKIDKKTVDFLITDTNFNIITVIELDDKSHYKKDRIERDNFVDSLMQKLNLQIIHIKTGESYESQIKEKLVNIIKAENPISQN